MSFLPIVKMILRTWMLCGNPKCKCVWYDDAENGFTGCPECGADFEVLDMEIIKD